LGLFGICNGHGRFVRFGYAFVCGLGMTGFVGLAVLVMRIFTFHDLTAFFGARLCMNVLP